MEFNHEGVIISDNMILDYLITDNFRNYYFPFKEICLEELNETIELINYYRECDAERCNDLISNITNVSFISNECYNKAIELYSQHYDLLIKLKKNNSLLDNNITLITGALTAAKIYSKGALDLEVESISFLRDYKSVSGSMLRSYELNGNEIISIINFHNARNNDFTGIKSSNEFIIKSLASMSEALNIQPVNHESSYLNAKPVFYYGHIHVNSLENHLGIKLNDEGMHAEIEDYQQKELVTEVLRVIYYLREVQKKMLENNFNSDNNYFMTVKFSNTQSDYLLIEDNVTSQESHNRLGVLIELSKGEGLNPGKLMTNLMPVMREQFITAIKNRKWHNIAGKMNQECKNIIILNN